MSYYNPAEDEAAQRGNANLNFNRPEDQHDGWAFDGVIGGRRISIKGKPGEKYTEAQVMDMLRTNHNWRNTGELIATPGAGSRATWNAQDDPGFYAAINPNASPEELAQQASAYNRRQVEMTPDGKRGVRGWANEHPVGMIAAMGGLAATGGLAGGWLGGAGGAAAGTTAGTAAGTTAGTTAGTAAGTAAGTTAGTTAGLGAASATLPEIVVTGTLGSGLGAAEIGAIGAGALGTGAATGWGGAGTGGFNGPQDFTMDGVGGGNAGSAASRGVIPGGAGMGSATSTGGLGSLGVQDYMQMAGQVMPQGDLGAQAQATSGTPNIRPPMSQRVNDGLGRMFNGLTPVDPSIAKNMDPAYLQQLRNQALMQMGLGMMGSAGRGAGFGEAMAQGIGLGQMGFGKNIENVYERGVTERAQKRADDRMAQEDARYQQGLGQRQEEFDYRRGQDEQQSQRWQQQFEADQAHRERVLAASNKTQQQGRVPAGYRLSPDGNLEPIPGGPADPAGPSARKASQTLRKEFRGLESVKDYEAALPMLQSAKGAPDTGYGDMDLIYAVGKTLDPGSVVREGELALTIKAGSPIERLVGTTRFTIGEGGRLTPNQRKQLVAMLDNRVKSYRQMYDRDFQQYSAYATQMGLSPDLVVGTPAERAYGEPDPLGIR